MHIIDKATWIRREHFELFMQMDYPQFNLCTEVDVTALVQLRAATGLPFSHCLLHRVLQAVNAVEEFRTRIRGEDVVCHDRIHASITDLRDDDTFKIVWNDYHESLETFARAASEATRNQTAMLDDESEQRDDVIYVTSLPWLTFTQLTHPIALGNAASIPRISWGRYQKRDDRLLVPLSIQLHHGLADGLHVARFLQRLREAIDD